MDESVKITIIHDDGMQRLGVLTVIRNNKVIFFCKTLERPYINNQNSISAIPKGIYDCFWTISTRFKRKMYLVDGVPGRSGIRIHPANYVAQLEGCIALGNVAKDINGDGNMDVLHSGDTCAAFEKLMDGKAFKLQIV
jgi:hypothetical protein